MSSDTVLRVKNISKCFEMYEKPIHRLFQTLCGGYKKFYKEFWALRDVNFELHKGECIGIIGKNGAGKSTLLQLITGTLQPTGGEVEVHGRIAALLELGSGFNMEFTGKENVYMNAAILGLSQEEIDARYQDILDFAEIGDFIDQPVKTYSSGMLVRLAFAVVAHVDAEVLIIDEALAVGDIFFQQKCMRFIRNFRKKHTILFVSHDTAAVANLCSKVVYLEKGYVKMLASSKEALDCYMKDLYGTQQKIDAVESQEERNLREEEIQQDYDMRLDFLNHSKFRNDIELFQFKQPEGVGKVFGAGGASLVDAAFYHGRTGERLNWIVGGETVRFQITALIKKDCFSPIIGFSIKDHLGQPVFVDNTYLTYREAPLSCLAGEKLRAVFLFRMPVLAYGAYSVSIALATGTQEKHQQEIWINDAMTFESRATSTLGLIGLHMQKILLEKVQS